jgi:sugar O-acyltransferase (sialic acid O-acetyltransferase NeuD family)
MIMIKAKILVPLLNTNEPEVRLARIHVMEGQAVEKGTILVTVESTKVTMELEAPASGFIRFLAREDDTLGINDLLAVITESRDELVEIKKEGERSQATGGKPVLKDVRITRPARLLAESLGLDLTKLPADRLVTETVVRQLAGPSKLAAPVLKKTGKPYLLIFGGGGHAKTIIDMIRQMKEWEIAGIVDDDPGLASPMLDVPVLGTRELLPGLLEQGVLSAVNAVGAIMDIDIRVRIFELLESTGFSLPVMIHPRATVEPSAQIEEGVQVLANAYIGSQTHLHAKCMVNTSAVVSHDCEIGSYTHIAPGALLAGEVLVGEKTLVGMGATTTIGVQIGSAVRIGNGAIVLADVPDQIIVQAGRFWTGKPA